MNPFKSRLWAAYGHTSSLLTRWVRSRRHFSVHRVAGALGAEVHNIDLKSVPTNHDLTKQIRDAFLEHQVLFFRSQNLSPDDFLSLSSCFGKPIDYPFVSGIEGYPQIIEVLKREHEKVNFGGVWHSDTSYLPEPPLGSILMAREVPPFGGDTIFANQYAAYEALSDGLKVTLSSLRGINTSTKADASKTREDRVKDSANTNVNAKSHEATHPVVRTHPETGRKALYINVAHTSHFEGWTPDESEPLLKFLFQHQVKPEFTCRFQWNVNSIAFWDNRCVQHNPVNDYHGHRRRMLRITLAGEPPK